jgi:hypothetical protein
MPWPHLVDSCIKVIPSMLSLSATINSVGIAMADDHHYTVGGTGEPEFARRVVDTIQSMNWFPPPTIAAVFNNRISDAAMSGSAKSLNRLMFLPGRGMQVIQVPGAEQRVFQIDGKRWTVGPAGSTK